MEIDSLTLDTQVVYKGNVYRIWVIDGRDNLLYIANLMNTESFWVDVKEVTKHPMLSQ